MFKQRLRPVINHTDRWLLKLHACTHTRARARARAHTHTHRTSVITKNLMDTSSQWPLSTASIMYTRAKTNYPLTHSSSLAFWSASSVFLSAHLSFSCMYLPLLPQQKTPSHLFFLHAAHLHLFPSQCLTRLQLYLMPHCLSVSLSFVLAPHARAVVLCNKSYFLSTEADAACSSMQSDRWYNIEVLQSCNLDLGLS